MAVTPNYGWPVPVATDYVKDGWEAISDLGNAIDTTVAGLGSGLKLIGATAFSATSTVNINNCFSSTYNNYRILIECTDGAGSTGNSLVWQSRNSGTNDSSAAYSTAGAFMVGSTLSASASTAQTSGFIGWTPISTGWGQTSIDVFQPFLSEYTTLLVHNSGVTSGNDSWANVQSMRRTATAHDGISFTFNNGNASGTVYVYGYQKA